MLRHGIVAFAVSAMVAAGAAHAQVASGYVLSDLNMREGPGTAYGQIAVIPGGSTVAVHDCTGGWCSVEYNGWYGHVSGRYLELAHGGYDAVPDQGSADVYYKGHDGGHAQGGYHKGREHQRPRAMAHRPHRAHAKAPAPRVYRHARPVYRASSARYCVCPDRGRQYVIVCEPGHVAHGKAHGGYRHRAHGSHRHYGHHAGRGHAGVHVSRGGYRHRY